MSVVCEHSSVKNHEKENSNNSLMFTCISFDSKLPLKSLSLSCNLSRTFHPHCSFLPSFTKLNNQPPAMICGCTRLLNSVRVEDEDDQVKIRYNVFIVTNKKKETDKCQFTLKGI